MDDIKIVELFWERSEDAIRYTQEKYGTYCYYIAYNILYSELDAEECVNDTYMHAWSSIPPKKPERLSTYLGKLTRNLALNRYANENAMKRRNENQLIFEEVEEFITSRNEKGAPVDEILLRDAINSFLEELQPETRIIFVRRYWYCSSIKSIAADYSISEGTVKSTLSRTRKRFREHLLKEGIDL